MRAIIVDDSRSIRMMLRRALARRGFEVLEAADGREALGMLGRLGGVDLALVDWHMPEMDGYELVCALRKDARMDRMAIMMVTTETDIAQVQRALAAGANEYLMKPFTDEAFVDKLTLLGFGAEQEG
jgi:two-component system chemotaxis response regulator CheY